MSSARYLSSGIKQEEGSDDEWVGGDVTVENTLLVATYLNDIRGLEGWRGNGWEEGLV